MKCPRCEGTGKCIECRGTGSITCSQCGGEGKLPLKLPTGAVKETKCHTCNGEGKVPCSPTCESCQGAGEITPVLQKEVREKYVPSWIRVKEYSAFASMAILVLNLIVFIVTSIGPSRDNIFYLLGILNGYAVLDGQWWRIVTAMFMHLGILHFIVNSYSLFILCPPIEKIVGSLRFVILYMVSGIAGNLLTVLIDPGMWSAGASGAIFGVFGAFFGLNYRYRIFPAALMNQLYMILVINVAISLTPGINLWAHLGGLAGGFLVSVLIKLR